MKDHISKGKVKESDKDAIGTQALLDFLAQCAQECGDDILQVAVVGQTNVSRAGFSLGCVLII